MRDVVVTGTSSFITQEQQRTLARLLQDATVVRHGVCIGADEAAHAIAVAQGIPVIGHPGVNKHGEPAKRARIHPAYFRDLYPEQPYLERNQAMVNLSSEMVAVVKSATWYRSGEWQAINAAKRAGLPVVLITPDGEEHRP